MAELEELVPTLTDAMQMVHADGVVFVGGDEDDIEVLNVVEGLHRRAHGEPAIPAHTRFVLQERS